MSKAVTGVLIATGLVVAAGFFIKSRLDADTALRADEARDQDGVRAVAGTSNDCNEAFPIAITVTNSTRRTLKSFRFHLGYYADGESLDYNADLYRSDWTVIVAPGEAVTSCWKRPSAPRGRYFARVQRDPIIDPAVFYAPGEFIPRGASP